MDYPQGYIFLEADTQLTPLKLLKDWFGKKSSIYVKDVSRTSKELNSRIRQLEDVHRFAFDNSDYRMKCIVFKGTCVSSMFIWKHIEKVLKVYWIDSPDHAMKFKLLHNCIEHVMLFDEHISDIEHSYGSVSDYIFSEQGIRPVGDDNIQRFFTGRHWGGFSEAEILVKQIAKNETRAGVLHRLDLESQESSP